MKASFSNSVLNLPTGKKFSFKFDIEKLIDFGDVVVVLLKVPPKSYFNENIYCVGHDGTLKWQVAQVSQSSEDSPFVDIVKKIDKLDAYTWSGIRARIKLDSGEIAHKRIAK